MSYSQQRPEFPELAIPQHEQPPATRRSPLRVIEPYVEFAADIEADIAKIEVASEDRARTASAKKGRGGIAGSAGAGAGSRNKTPQQIRSSTAGTGQQGQGVGQHTTTFSRGPESGRSARSPRSVKTAPESSTSPRKIHTQNKSSIHSNNSTSNSTGNNQNQQPQNSSSMHSSQDHFSEGDGSEVTVRESLQSLKRSSVRGREREKERNEK